MGAPRPRPTAPPPTAPPPTARLRARTPRARTPRARHRPPAARTARQWSPRIRPPPMPTPVPAPPTPPPAPAEQSSGSSISGGSHNHHKGGSSHAVLGGRLLVLYLRPLALARLASFSGFSRSFRPLALPG